MRFVCLVLMLFLIACGGGGGGEGLRGTSQAFDQVASPPKPPNPAIEPGPVAVPPVAPDNPVDPVEAALDQELRAGMTQAGVQVLPTPPDESQAKIDLGQALMFDKILSGNLDVKCATCHHPDLHTSDGLSLSIGVGGTGLGPARELVAGKDFIPRNAPHLFNLGTVNPMFWDGRVSGDATTGFDTPAGGQFPSGLDHVVAAQAMFPVTSREEMRGEAGDLRFDGAPNELALLGDGDFTNIWASLMARLVAIPEYQTLFQAAFPGIPVNELGFEHAANAIGAFELHQWSGVSSPFDRYVAGDDSALSLAQKRGGVLFYGRARCAACHSGGLLSDLRFHNIASPQVGPGRGVAAPLDLGRGAITGLAGDNFRFRTPTLRNVALTGPWMHAGSYTTLEATVAHYRNPAQALQNYDPNQMDPRLRNQVHVQDQLDAGVLNNLSPFFNTPVTLSPQDVRDLVAFLGALTDPAFLDQSGETPATVPSGLPVR